MRFRHLLSVLACGLALAACGPVEVPDDAAACAGFLCTAGTCFSSGGQPMCRCGEWEVAAGVPCQVGGFEEPDDHGGSPESATVLTLPMPVRYAALQEGPRSELRDRDLFAFTAVPGHAYSFNCGQEELVQCTLRLLDASGRAVLLSTGLRNNDPHVVFGVARLETAGPWYVEVSSDRFVGRYSYQLVDLGPDDHGDTRDAATPLQAFRDRTPIPVTHSTSEDVDVFRFHAVAGHGYRFRCEHPWAVYKRLQLTSASGEVLAALPKFSSGRAIVSARAEATSDWFAEVAISSAEFPLTSSCWLEDLGADEHADVLAGATPLRTGVPVSVTLQSQADVDVLAFTGEADHVYELWAEGTAGEVCQVWVVDARGLAQVLGSTQELVFEPSVTGTYFLVLKNPSEWMPTFLLTLVDLGRDDYGDTVQTATDVGTAREVTSRFDTWADTDAIAFAIEPRHVYLAECTPSCDMALEDYQHTSSQGTGRYLVHAMSKERLVVLLRPRSGPGGFTVRLQDLAVDDHGDGIANAGWLTLPATVSGVVSTTVDEDFFVVSLSAMRTYRLSASLSGLQLMVLDPMYSLVTPRNGEFFTSRTGNYLIRIYGAQGLTQTPWSFTLSEP